MKATIFQKCSLALMLAIAPFFWGCDQGQASSATANDTPTPINNTAGNVSSSQPPADLMAVDTNQPAATNVDDDALANADGKLMSTPDTASTNLNTNPQLTDLVKLVQAGVGEGVLMAYVTNSPTAFNLSSDDIVYLNDLGTSETVITAMLQRDQHFNGSAASLPAQAATPPTETTPATLPQPAPDQSAMAAAQTPPLTPSADIEQEVQQAPNVSYSYFYDSLSPYGNWINIAGYGPCWQPTVVVVNPGWQPYCDRGRWAYTDSGWCWVSDYSWGWAPFHYGRWFHHNRWGWCWAPDTVWGPAWVSWRYSDAYCGWAPLPPSACYRPGFGFTYYGHSVGFNFTFGLGVNHFTFVPLNHFHDRYPGRFRVEHREITKIYNTTIINNQIIRGSNNRIINRGVPVDRVSRATHTDIRPIHIRADADGPRTAQLGRDGRSLSVYRPELPRPRPGVAPKFVGEGVQPAPHFDLHSRVDRVNTARENPTRNPVTSAGPERRPIIPNPALNRPADNVGRDSRDNRFSQPNTEKPGSLIMRGANQPNRPDRVTPSRNDNSPAQTPPANVRRGPDNQPQLPAQPNRENNNPRIMTPPLRPQQSDSDVRRSNSEQQRQLLQQQQQMQQQQQQQRDVLPRQQQRDFQPQPVVPTPRQEAPARSFEVPRTQPRGNNNQDFNPGFRSQPPVRSEPVAPPRTFESRPSQEYRSAPPQYSAPARNDNGGGGGGGGQRGGGGGGGGGGNGGGGGGNRDNGGNSGGNGNGRNR